MSVKETMTPKKYELVAPDGGWGYIIWIALTINMITTTAFVSCIGLIYKELYIQLKMDSTNIGLLNGVSSISVSIAGLITGPLLVCLSIRKLGIISAILLNLGSFALVFVNSIALFFLSSAILQCFGSGMLVNLTFTTLNQYFVKKRMLTVALTQTITAIISLFTPQFIKWSADEYGCRGTMILLVGVYMQTFIAIAIMQPVEWHFKKKEIEMSEENINEFITLLKHDDATTEKLNSPATKLPDNGFSFPKYTDKKDISGGDVKNIEKKNSIFREMFSDFFDIPFLKSYLLSNASLGLAITTFTDVYFITMLPQALYAMDWTEGEVAWAISLYNFGELLTKILFILFNNILLKFGSSEICIVGLIMAFFTRLGMLWSDNPTLMLAFIVMIGMSRSISGMLNPLVIGESVDKEKFTSAMGIFMVLYGLMYLIIGPLIGAVRDLTNSYATAFYIITSCYAMVSLFWLIELLYKKNKDKRVKKIKGRDSA